MSTIPNTSDSLNDYLDDLSKANKSRDEIPVVNGLQTEYAHSNRWIGYIPISNVLGSNYSNLELNLTTFTIPQMEMGSTQSSFKSYQYFLPTKVMDPGSKEITFNYIIDAKFQNYKALASWMTGIEGNINEVDADTDTSSLTSKYLLDVRVWLIDQFKNRLLDLCFYNAWIKTFDVLQLESNSTDEIHHAFTMYYSNFEIKKAVE